jgi:hypothetical protein
MRSFAFLHLIRDKWTEILVDATPGATHRPRNVAAWALGRNGHLAVACQDQAGVAFFKQHEAAIVASLQAFLKNRKAVTKLRIDLVNETAFLMMHVIAVCTNAILEVSDEKASSTDLESLAVAVEGMRDELR